MTLFSAAAMLVAAGGTALTLMSGQAPLERENALPGPVITDTQAGEAGLTRPSCAVTATLVPTCGRWWGVAPGALTSTPRQEALRLFEDSIGRQADIYHSYHRNAALFPTAQEREIAAGPEGRRLLLINWKPSTEDTWRAVAESVADEHIDALAAHINKTYEDRFFLTVWHEPENDVDATPGSGMTADDYAAMYRHVVLRLREQGVDNIVTVMTFMASPVWGATPWFPDLYPGDDVVDWIGTDPYIYARPQRTIGSFHHLVNRPGASWPGFYTWAQAVHPTKPIMLAEWGVFAGTTEPWRKANVYRSVARQIHAYPGIKALVYFDSPRAPKGDTRVDSDPDALAAYRELGRDPAFVGPAVP